MSHDFEDFNIFNVEVGDMDLQKCSKMCNFKREKSLFLCFANIKWDRLDCKLTITQLFKDVSFQVKFGYMGCCDFSINNPQYKCLVPWLLRWNITILV